MDPISELVIREGWTVVLEVPNYPDIYTYI